ncbi:hypothetical protein MTO96_038587 [Rhipicephalus appendiculatus]
MPLLPRSDFKIVIRPRGGLDVATTGTVRLASAIYRAANVPAHEAGEDTVCCNNVQNIIVVSTPHAAHVGKYRQLQAITIGDRRHEVSAYETAPEYTVKGIIKGIPLEEDARSIHTNIVHTRNPKALAAKRLSNTTTVIVAFEGPRVPSYLRYGGALFRCTLYRKQVDMCHCCGRLGHRMEECPNPLDKVCRGCDALNPGPDHQCSPRCKLAAEEAEAAATTDPDGNPAQDPGPPVEAAPVLGAAHRGPGSSNNAGLAAAHLEGPQRGTPRPLIR